MFPFILIGGVLAYLAFSNRKTLTPIQNIPAKLPGLPPVSQGGTPPAVVKAVVVAAAKKEVAKAKSEGRPVTAEDLVALKAEVIRTYGTTPTEQKPLQTLAKAAEVVNLPTTAQAYKAKAAAAPPAKAKAKPTATNKPKPKPSNKPVTKAKPATVKKLVKQGAVGFMPGVGYYWK